MESNSNSPAAGFAAAILGTAAAWGAMRLFRRLEEHEGWTPIARRIHCEDELCPSRERCEVGYSYCPSCGDGPLKAERLTLYPARINHREAYTCISCMERAHVDW